VRNSIAPTIVDAILIAPVAVADCGGGRNGAQAGHP
jgi:hypothetical protein